MWNHFKSILRWFIQCVEKWLIKHHVTLLTKPIFNINSKLIRDPPWTCQKVRWRLLKDVGSQFSASLSLLRVITITKEQTTITHLLPCDHREFLFAEQRLYRSGVKNVFSQFCNSFCGFRRINILKAYKIFKITPNRVKFELCTWGNTF